MPGFYHGIRVFQVFGAGTNVGKTLVSAALVRAANAHNFDPIYIKPIATGPENESDELHVRQYGLRGRDAGRARVLERRDRPFTPPPAAAFEARQRARAGHGPDGWDQPTDSKVLGQLVGAIRRTAIQFSINHHRIIAIMETTGGVLSPSFEGTPQADLYKHHRFPAILVCDPGPGGISNSIAAFESLKMRGYDVRGTITLHNPVYENDVFLTRYFEEKIAANTGIIPPPPRNQDPHEDAVMMERWYTKTAPVFDRFIIALLGLEEIRERKMNLMRENAPGILWWPSTQHGQLKEDNIAVVDSARHDFFNVYDPSVRTPGAPQIYGMIDSSASCGTQAFGHGDPTLPLEAAAAASRYGHVLYPRMVHEPAYDLAESLLRTVGEGWARRVFYSDNGSTGVEVAIKMAMRVAGYNVPCVNQIDSHRWGVIGLRGAYHGDTLGAMDATQSDAFKSEWHKERGVWLDAPTIAFKNGEIVVSGGILGDDFVQKFASLDDIYSLKARLDSDLALRYREAIETTLRQHVINGQVFGAVLLEPLLMGVGGMKFVDPLFQNVLVRTARSMSSLLLPKPVSSRTTIPVIFDEVFVGMGRLGSMSTAQALGVYPDIAVYAKMLTGGLMPLAATLATEDVFNAFLSENKEDALNHGHSYTANPIACAVAVKSVEVIHSLLLGSPELQMSKRMWLASERDSRRNKDDTVWSVWSPEFVKQTSKAANVEGVMTLGTVLAVQLKDQDAAGHPSVTADEFFDPIRKYDETLDFGIHFRTIGNVAYFTAPSLRPPPIILRQIEGRLWKLWGIEPPETTNAGRPDIPAKSHIAKAGGEESSQKDAKKSEEAAKGGAEKSGMDGDSEDGLRWFREFVESMHMAKQTGEPDGSGQGKAKLSANDAMIELFRTSSHLSHEDLFKKMVGEYLPKYPEVLEDDESDSDDEEEKRQGRRQGRGGRRPPGTRRGRGRR